MSLTPYNQKLFFVSTTTFSFAWVCRFSCQRLASGEVDVIFKRVNPVATKGRGKILRKSPSKVLKAADVKNGAVRKSIGGLRKIRCGILDCRRKNVKMLVVKDFNKLAVSRCESDCWIVRWFFVFVMCFLDIRYSRDWKISKALCVYIPIIKFPFFSNCLCGIWLLKCFS